MSVSRLFFDCLGVSFGIDFWVPDVLADSAGWLGWLAGMARIPGHCPGVGNLGAKSKSRAKVGANYVLLGCTNYNTIDSRQ